MLKTFQQSGSPSSVYSPSLPVSDRHNKLLQVLAASRIEVFVRNQHRVLGYVIARFCRTTMEYPVVLSYPKCSDVRMYCSERNAMRMCFGVAHDFWGCQVRNKQG